MLRCRLIRCWRRANGCLTGLQISSRRACVPSYPHLYVFLFELQTFESVALLKFWFKVCTSWSYFHFIFWHHFLIQFIRRGVQKGSAEFFFNRSDIESLVDANEGMPCRAKCKTKSKKTPSFEWEGKGEDSERIKYKTYSKTGCLTFLFAGSVRSVVKPSQ